MGSIGTQTSCSVPGAVGPIVFISAIKGTEASTQCCLPELRDVTTSTEEAPITLLQSRVEKESVGLPGGGCRRRGRPRRPQAEAGSNGWGKEAAVEVEQPPLTGPTSGVLTHIRIKRERKIPIKFDPSDVNETSATSVPASESRTILESEEPEPGRDPCKTQESDIGFIADSVVKGRGCNIHNNTKGNSNQHSDGGDTKCILMNWEETGKVKENNGKEKVDKGEEAGIDYEENTSHVQDRNLQIVKQKNICLNFKQRLEHKKQGHNPYTCEKCNVDFRLMSIYSKHMLNHEIAQGKHSAICKVCKKTLSSRINLRRHMLIHTGKPFTCELCGKGFTGRYLLREHLATDHNKAISAKQMKTRHQCNACQRYMSTKTALQYHQAQSHPCAVCGLKWPCRNSLRGHVLQVHDGAQLAKDGRLECAHCGKTFMYRHTFLSHVAQHSNEKKYKCQKCKKLFLTSQSLCCHQKQVHEKHNYRYPCGQCHKVFICNAKLIEHIRTHTGEKPFQCDVCGAAFAAKATYKSHMRLIHRYTLTNKQREVDQKVAETFKYTCPLCGTKDFNAGELKTHCWQAHEATVIFSNQHTSVHGDGDNREPSGFKENVAWQDIEGSKEIVVSEENSEVTVSDVAGDIGLPEGRTEIMVSEGNAITD